jgi:hypothetical protein
MDGQSIILIHTMMLRLMKNVNNTEDENVF